MATITSQPVARQRKARGGEREQRLGLIGGGLTYGALPAMALISVFPFWWMIVASTRRSETILTLPPPLLPGSDLMTNYNEMFAQINFWRAMFNSVFVGGVGAGVVLFFCSLGGYAFSKFQFPGRNKLFAIMLATMMIPGILGIIPSFMLMKWLRLLGNHPP